MSEDKANVSWLELLKYPVLVFSILLALLVAKYLLGLEFGVITELSTQGIKFAQQSKATADAIAELDAKLGEALTRVAALEESISHPTPDTREARDLATFSAAQTVSDATAKVATIAQFSEKGTQQTLKGYIWIGDYDDREGWKTVKIASYDTRQPIKLAPSEMLPGTEYRLLWNAIVRDGKPANDSEYFHARKSIGVAARGSLIRLIRKPDPFDREFAVQYWAEMELVESGK